MNVSKGSDGYSGFILSNNGIRGILANDAFLSAFAAFATAQILKVVGDA
jgi:hypothetical protein